VQSFVTTLTPEQMNNTKGGIYIIKGRKFDYRVRWTSLDTRAAQEGVNVDGGGK
jgi:hypothetical protein